MRFVQVIPSGEVATLPLFPATQKTESFHVSARIVKLPPRAVFRFDVLLVQVIPSGEVAADEFTPTAKNVEPFHAIACG